MPISVSIPSPNLRFLLLFVLLLQLGACTADGGRARPEQVSLSAFARPPAEEEAALAGVPLPVAVDQVVNGAASDVARAEEDAEQDAEQDAEEEVAEEASSAEPAPVGLSRPARDEAERRWPRALEPGERLIVDALVGQVNGRPIFADEFFEPIEDQLIAISERTSSREFAEEASQVIFAELRAVILDALFIAEAEAQIDVEQRPGVFAWLQQQREELVAEAGGTRSATEQRLREEGKTLESRLEEIRNAELVKMLFAQRILPRVVVSWQDVVREYERRYDRFNPPANVTVARIVVPTTEENAEVLREIDQRLAAGDDFLEVADAVRQPGNGIWQTFEVGQGGLAEVNVASETMQRHLAALEMEGDTSEAFEVGSSTWWLHLAAVERPPGRDLYDPDVQRELTRAIRSARTLEEQDRYIRSLLERGIYDELDAMAERLMTIALLRYGP